MRKDCGVVGYDIAELIKISPDVIASIVGELGFEKFCAGQVLSLTQYVSAYTSLKTREVMSSFRWTTITRFSYLIRHHLTIIFLEH